MSLETEKGQREWGQSGQMPKMAAGLELREITRDSLGAVLDLAVEPEQEPYVATNARSIAEAHSELPPKESGSGAS